MSSNCPLDSFGNYIQHPIGSLVEVRAANIDELFYEAKIVAYDEDDNSYSVEYEDGTFADGLWYSSFRVPSERCLVYENESLRIVDGHVYISQKTHRARLLAFQESPQLFQSAMIIDEFSQPRHDIIVFEFTQGLLYSLALLPESSVTEENHSAFSFLVIGAGAGCLNMALRHFVPTAHIDVVDLSQSVIDASVSYFGVPADDPLMKLHVVDAKEYVSNLQGQNTFYDIIVVDVALENGVAYDDPNSDGLEIPPRPFLDPSWWMELGSLLSPHGWISINALARDEVMCEMIELMESLFPTVYVIAVNPNYVIHVSNESREREITCDEVFSQAQKLGIHRACDAVSQKIHKTKKYKRKGIALGWFTSTELVKLL